MAGLLSRLMAPAFYARSHPRRLVSRDNPRTRERHRRHFFPVLWSPLPCRDKMRGVLKNPQERGAIMRRSWLALAGLFTAGGAAAGRAVTPPPLRKLRGLIRPPAAGPQGGGNRW